MGIVKEGLPSEAKFAMGTELQILPGVKRDPLDSLPIAERPEVQAVSQSVHEGAEEVQSGRCAEENGGGGAEARLVEPRL